MPEDVTAPPPDPTPRPAVDEEKIRQAEELRQAKAALAEVGEMVKAGKLKLVEGEEKKEEPEDETALVDRKELKRFAEDIKKTVAGAIVETTHQSAKQIRASQIEHLRPKLKNFDKYESEVNALLDKVDPRLAADPNTIRQVYQVVRSNHQEEEIEEEVRARLSTQPAAEEDNWGGETEEEVVETKAAPQAAGRAPQRTSSPVARSGGVAPSGDASASRPVLRHKAESPPLSRDERFVAEQFGIKSAEEYRRYGDPTWKPDITGFRGRDRIK